MRTIIGSETLQQFSHGVTLVICMNAVTVHPENRQRGGRRIVFNRRLRICHGCLMWQHRFEHEGRTDKGYQSATRKQVSYYFC